MLTASELEGIRETSEENLPDVCNVVTIEQTRNARGDAEEVAITGPDFACAVMPLSETARQSGMEAVLLDRLGVLEAWTIRASREVAIRLQDRILVDVGGHERMLEVQAAPGPKSYEAIHRFVGTEIR